MDDNELREIVLLRANRVAYQLDRPQLIPRLVDGRSMVFVHEPWKQSAILSLFSSRQDSFLFISRSLVSDLTPEELDLLLVSTINLHDGLDFNKLFLWMVACGFAPLLFALAVAVGAFQTGPLFWVTGSLTCFIIPLLSGYFVFKFVLNPLRDKAFHRAVGISGRAAADSLIVKLHEISRPWSRSFKRRLERFDAQT